MPNLKARLLTMPTDGFVELVAGDAELFRPIGNVRSHLGIDLGLCGLLVGSS